MKKLSGEEYISRCKEIHGNDYDYSGTKYTGMHDYIEVRCNKCGKIFKQKAYKHIRGQGCPFCNGTHKKTIEEFSDQANKVHYFQYDYSKGEYINTMTPLLIHCKKCGKDFYQFPYAHLQGKGCPFCNGGRKLTKDWFIEKTIKVHGNKYDYSKVEYIDSKTKVCIICPEHGEFWQTPNDHLDGCGCPKCNESNLEEATRVFLEENNINYIQYHNDKWLGNQTLDFYLPDYNVGIECQGIQHFEPVEFFGGEKRFKRQVELDEKKKNSCVKNNVKLLYIIEVEE